MIMIFQNNVIKILAPKQTIIEAIKYFIGFVLLISMFVVLSGFFSEGVYFLSVICLPFYLITINYEFLKNRIFYDFFVFIFSLFLLFGILFYFVYFFQIFPFWIIRTFLYYCMTIFLINRFFYLKIEKINNDKNFNDNLKNKNEWFFYFIFVIIVLYLILYFGKLQTTFHFS